MSIAVATAIWAVILVYLTLGALAAAYMLSTGLKRIDANAARAPLRVKALIAPGLVVLWPLMIAKTRGAAQ